MDTLRDLYLTYQSLVAYVGINTLLALSVYATLAAGQLSLANAGFMAIGAYTGALLTLHTALPFPLTLLAATMAPVILAVPLGLPVLRLRGVFLAIATIGFGEVVRLFFVNWSYANGAMGLDAIPQRTRLWMIWILVLGALVLFARLRGSRAGLALAAIREDETAARSIGIDTTAHKLAVFALGAALAGLAGALEAHLTYTVSPGGFGFGRVVEMLVQAVVGGTAVYYGPLLGAVFLTSLPEILREIGARAGIEPGAFRPMLNGVVLLLVILFLPNGLASLPSRWRARRARR